MSTVNRSLPPIAPTLPKVRIPGFEQHALGNGLGVVLLRDTRFPSVSLRLGIAGGNRIDPTDATGVAETMCSMLNDGTQTRTSRDISDAMGLIGASLHFSASDDFFIGTRGVLEDNLERFLELFSDCLLQSIYPEHELDLYKQNRIQELLLERGEPGYWADSTLYRKIFGSHPYAVTSPEPEHLEALERDSLVTMWQKHLGPKDAVLVMVGDLPPTGHLLTLLEGYLGQWNNETAALVSGASQEIVQPEVLLVHRPGSVQAELRLGRPAIARNHPDYFPLTVLNTVLGGGASSRLFMEIREKQGLAYHVSSGVMALMEGGLMALTTQVSMDRAGEAIRGLHHEMRRLYHEPIPDAELQSIRNYLSGTFVLRLESHGSLANQLSAIKMLDLGDDYLERYVERVAAVSGEDLRATADRYFHPEDYTIIAVGDEQVLRPQLEAFGNVTVTTAE